MIVLYILDPAIIGGATKAFLTFISVLKERGVTPIVCTQFHTTLSDELLEMGIKNFPIGHREMITCYERGGIKTIWRQRRLFKDYLKNDVYAIRIIQKTIDMEDVDIIHTNSTRSDVGFFLSAMYRKPHVVHAREFGDKDYNCFPINPFWKIYYNLFSTRFLCVSNAVKKHWIKKGICSKKCQRVYDGIAYEKIVQSSDESKRECTLKLVMSGSVQPTKGQHLAIMAIGGLPVEVKKNITLDFIGWDSGDVRNKLNSLGESVGLINQVTFWGERKDVLQLIGKYHVGLMCSKSEGFGLVTAEFMFAKLGVIASDSGASPELIEDGVCGLNFEMGSVDSLSEKILYYYYHRDELIQHSNAARKKALEYYKADTNAENIYKVYAEITRK